MKFLGSVEVISLVCDPVAGVAKAVKMRVRSREKTEVLRAVTHQAGDVSDAAAEALRELNPGGAAWLVLSMPLEGGEIFECTLPDGKPEVLMGALRFEAPREIMNLADDLALQYARRGRADDEGMVKVRAYAVESASVVKLLTLLNKWRKKLDAFVHPLLAVPAEIAGGEKLYFPEIEKDFYYQDSVWYPADLADTASYNTELLQYLRRNCRWNAPETADYESYLTAITVGKFALRKLVADNAAAAGINLLPNYMRPARFRNQLRLMVLLIVLLLGFEVCKSWGGWVKTYQRQQALTSEVNTVRKRIAKMRKKVKAGEKELKELKRLADLKIGDRECMGYLALLSEKLPDDVLVNNFRWNDGNIDLMLQTNSEIDLVSFFNRLSGFKVVSASQRTNNNTNLTVGTVKLTVNPAKEKGTKKK